MSKQVQKYKLIDMLKNVKAIKTLILEDGTKLQTKKILKDPKIIKREDLRKAMIGWFSKKKGKYLKYLLNDFEFAAQKKGYIPLWNLPQHPDFNPIELAWAMVKYVVRKCFFFGNIKIKLYP